MRTKIKDEIKEALRDLCMRTRTERGITQGKMSEALMMSERAYSDLERGIYSCGTLTAVLLLIEADDSGEILEKLSEKITTKAYHDETELK